MKPISLGIIGCGNVLEAYMPACDKLRAQNAATVVVACGRSNQESRAKGLGVPRFTSQESEVLTSSEVEVVLILTSMPEHARLVRAALEAGKHVLVEKPLATTLKEARELLDLAKSRNRQLLCAPFTILSPTFQTLAERIRRGDIGKPCSARARYGWAGPSWSDWFYRPGGGCLFDLGVYSFTTLTGLLGPAKRVMAMTGVAIPEREINGKRVRVQAEDNAQVLLDFGDSCFGIVTCGFTLQQYRSPAVEVYGSNGVLQMLGDDWDPDGYEFWQNDLGAWQLYKETAPNWSWTDGLSHLIDCLQTDQEPLVTTEHAFHVLEIMLQAQASSEEGRSMEVHSSFTLPRFTTPVEDLAAHLRHDRTREHVS